MTQQTPVPAPVFVTSLQRFLLKVCLTVLVLCGVNARAADTITVLNPTGFPPPIERSPLAERSTSLDGRTVYLVDITFDNGDLLLMRMQEWMARNTPRIKTVFRRKQGIYAADDPKLWQEIKDNNGVMVVAIGH